MFIEIVKNKEQMIVDYNNRIVHDTIMQVDYNDRNLNRVKLYNEINRLKKELEQLKGKNVKGIILDLRNNGGGSLKTVVDMTGYFIDEGPVVQVKSTGGKKEVLKDTDPSIIWDGPLVVLVNEFSASASEIIAAA